MLNQLAFGGHPWIHVVIHEHLTFRQPPLTWRSEPTYDFTPWMSFTRPISLVSWLVYQLLVHNLKSSLGEIQQWPANKKRPKKEADHTRLILLLLVAKSLLTLCNPMDCSTLGFLVLHYLPEFSQTHVHWANEAIQPSPPLSPASSPALNFFPASGSFPVTHLFASGGKGIEASAFVSVLLMHINNWFSDAYGAVLISKGSVTARWIDLCTHSRYSLRVLYRDLNGVESHR